MNDFDMDQNLEDLMGDLIYFKHITEEEKEFFQNVKEFNPDNDLLVIIKIIMISNRMIANKLIELDERIKQLEDK